MSNSIRFGPSLAGFTKEHLLDLIIQNELKFNSNGDTGLYVLREDGTSDNFVIERVDGATTNVLTITPTGDVGLGTTTPDEKLVLYESTAPVIKFITDSNPTGAIIGVVLETMILSNTDTAGDFQFVINGNGVLDINNNGNLVIDGIASEGTIRFNNDNTGNTTGDGTIVGLTSSTFLINNQEATNINFSHGITIDMSIDSSGEVGIGISSPTERLHVKEDTNGQTIIQCENDDGGTAAQGLLRVDMGGATTSLAATGSGYTTTTGALRTMGSFLDSDISNSGGLSIMSRHATTGEIRFYTAGLDLANQRMVIDNAGLVGIGLSPVFNLDIVGTTIRLDSDSTSTANLRFDTTNSAGTILQRQDDGDVLIGDISNNGGNLLFYASGSNNGRITSTGLAIGGTFNPSITLAIGDSDTGIDWVSDGVFRLMSNNVSRLHFDAGAGNIGFGDADDPQADFDFQDATNPTIRLTDGRSNYGSTSGVDLGTIQFYSRDGSFDDNLGGVFTILVESDTGSVSPDGRISFIPWSNGTIATGDKMTLDNTGDLDISGTLTKDAGSFDIPHPNPSMEAQGYRLRHCFVESNTAGDNHYYLQCEATTDNEVVEVDLPSYYNDLNENTRMFIQSVGHFGRAYGTINNQGTKLNITCELSGKYDILCIGTRKDYAATDYFVLGAEYQGTREDYRIAKKEKKWDRKPQKEKDELLAEEERGRLKKLATIEENE